ncbi:LytTR family DNA-binding domain-containing protein [Pedobacter sp.]|jgi:hypothetical protein|uniref:LytTR family DNA-binding domain-containing protein n=1 Tax=Pedobacter sp. TaxID=1411316 RepID=UPI002C6DA50E|nr:LytTR family DNA-binding domain-containing protein [Pedobacter sp.]HWW43290.1 LytTR family DNA-binding domain-containing protein [Pedobacter sp.]
MNLKNFLQQPYPFPDKQVKVAVLVGLGIGLLMFLLKPFGLSNISVKYDHLFSAGYGLVSFLVLLFNGLVVLRLFSDLRWTIFRQICWSCWSLFCLGLANYVYTFVCIGRLHFTMAGLVVFQLYTLIIGSIPVTFLVLIRQNRMLRLNRKSAEVLNDHFLLTEPVKDVPGDIVLTAENGKTELNIQVSDLAFIESDGNYIQVYRRKDGLIAPVTIRNSIVKAEAELGNHAQLMRCHRAFIVNTDFIEHVKGNAQGYRLGIKGSDREVYVSRQYTKLIKQVVNKG